MRSEAQHWRRRLAKALKLHDEPGDSETDEFNSVLLQITMAVMLIFMIAFVLFMNKVGGEISRIDALKQEISQAEKERLLRLVEEVAERYRIRYGLKAFLLIDPVTGEKSYLFSEVIRNGKLVSSAGPSRHSFLTGAAAARRDYRSMTALTDAWLRQISPKAGAAAGHEPIWLHEQVTMAIRKVRREVVEVQTLAAAAVQEHFVRHPELVKDPAIRKLLNRINAEPDSPDRQNRLDELSRRLREYVYRELESQCGTPMLEEDFR